MDSCDRWRCDELDDDGDDGGGVGVGLVGLLHWTEAMDPPTNRSLVCARLENVQKNTN